MPVDPNIALAAQGPQLPNISASLMQGEQMASLAEQRQAMAAELAQRTQALTRQNQVQTDLANAIQQGKGLREPTLAYLAQNHPLAYQAASQYFDASEKSAAEIQQLKADVATKNNALNNAMLDHVGRMADQALTFSKDDPSLLPGAITVMAAHYGQQFPDEKDRAMSMIQPLLQQSPDTQRQALLSMRANAPYYQQQQAKLQEPVKLGPGDILSAGGQTVAQGLPALPTEAQLDAQFQALQKKQMLGQPLSSDEQASLQAYQTRKLLGPEAAAAAAANRQTLSIDQQNNLQAASQAFQVRQAGRSELTNKVEQPLLDAQEKASTLRSVVAAAQNGNMLAGNVQSLLGVLGLVTMEGVKRINTTELEQVGGAGSLLERIKGAAGGVVAGQPLSPKLQSDLVQLSNVLEQSAKQKYMSGFQAVTKRYGLTDEQPLVSIGAPVAAAGPATTTAAESAEHRVWRLTGKSGPEPK